jgi:hypothetical protein
MSLRVVLYAEGTADTAGEIRVRPKPREPLGEEWLGPAHRLVRRAIARARPRLPEAAILFEEPLRVGVRVARGSDLLHRPTLRQLLTWVTGKRPDLAVVLVDRDGAAPRHTELSVAIRDLAIPVTSVIAVAIEEFESWLIGDSAAVAQVLPEATPPPQIESLDRRQAKSLLQQWSASHQDKRYREIRLSLANLSNLDTLERRCPSFARFTADLSAALPQ